MKLFKILLPLFAMVVPIFASEHPADCSKLVEDEIEAELIARLRPGDTESSTLVYEYWGYLCGIDGCGWVQRATLQSKSEAIRYCRLGGDSRKRIVPRYANLSKYEIYTLDTAGTKFENVLVRKNF